MQAMLEELNTLPSVLGSMRCDAAGAVVAAALPPGLLAGADLDAAGRAVAEATRALHGATGQLTHLDLRFVERRLVIRPLAEGAVVVLCDKAANPRELVPALSRVVSRHEGGAATGRAQGGSPAALEDPASPAAPPRREAAPLPDLLPQAPPPPPPVRPPQGIRGGPPSLVVGSVAGAALLLVVGLAWWLWPRQAPAPAPAGHAAVSAPLAAPAPVVVLRIGGAKAFAAELAPALAKAFLEQLQVKDVKVSKLEAHRFQVQGDKDGTPWAVQIDGLNTPDGFARLAEGKLDVAMSGRRIKPEWQAKLDALGPMAVPGREHVVGLSGMAIIVNQANPVAQLDRAQLADVFSGKITDWSQLGGGRRGKASPSPIHVYTGDDKLGITELFRAFVLDKRPYAESARRLGAVQDLNDAVGLDPQGIGYVFLPFVRGTRAVPVAEGGEPPLLPTAFTLATEDYFLTHRIYFYSVPRADSPHLLKFTQFVLGPEGQAVVRKAGYVELSVATSPREPPAGAPPGYARLVRGATRLSSTFRFETGSADFDARALQDLERVTAYLVENRLNGEAVRVLGFTDAQGRADVNVELARSRADQVVRALAQRGVTGVQVDGFGAALPVASNATAEGRQRNRRVEVWVAR